MLPPQPPQAFSIRDLRLYFPELKPWVARSASLLAVCLVDVCANVGPWGASRHSACPVPRHSESGPLGLSVRKCGAAGSASGQTACPFHPTLRQARSCQGHASPLRPGAVSAPPTSLDVCFFFIYLVSDFLDVGFSVSSGCARRRSVSTYATILVLGKTLFKKNLCPG